jgi:hypothetical protein
MVRSRTIDSAAPTVLDRGVQAHTVADSLPRAVLRPATGNVFETTVEQLATAIRLGVSATASCSHPSVTSPSGSRLAQHPARGDRRAARLGLVDHPPRPRWRHDRHVCRPRARAGRSPRCGIRTRCRARGRPGLPARRRAGGGPPRRHAHPRRRPARLAAGVVRGRCAGPTRRRTGSPTPAAPGDRHPHRIADARRGRDPRPGRPR